jgi:hypothetical protein
MTATFSLVGAGALLMLALTLIIAFARTLFEGVESYATFDRAGFTLSNYVNGTVPPEAARANPIDVGDSAEIEIIDGRIRATETRTIVKHHS